MTILRAILATAIGLGLFVAAVVCFGDFMTGADWNVDAELSGNIAKDPVLVAVICLVGANIALVLGVGQPSDFRKCIRGYYYSKSLWSAASLRQRVLICGVLSLAVALLLFDATFIALTIRDFRPPLYWHRVGGVGTDWVIGYVMIVPMSLVVAWAILSVAWEEFRRKDDESL